MIRRRLNFLLLQEMSEDRAGGKGNGTKGIKFFIYNKNRDGRTKQRLKLNHKTFCIFYYCLQLIQNNHPAFVTVTASLKLYF